MSMRRSFWLVCDQCLTEDQHPGWYAEDVRADAKRDGWKRIKGQDICPTCQGKIVCSVCDRP